MQWRFDFFSRQEKALFPPLRFFCGQVIHWEFFFVSEQGWVSWEMDLARDDSVEALHFLAADVYAFAWVETF